jgi:c-di-GMP-binding flagellar brake protein YcgR
MKQTKKLTERVAATGQLLMRSGIEIGRLLQAVREAGAPLSASLESGEVLFLSRLLSVEAQAGSIVIACSDVKQANSALLAAPVVIFGCTHEGVRYEFAAGHANECLHQGAPAIRLAFPPTVLALQRRARPRLAIPPKTPIACAVRLGPLGFEAQLADITPDGLGAIIYDPGIRLEPGMKLRGVEIALGRSVVKIDLEVKHFTRVPLPGGAWAIRAGCKILGKPSDLERLVSHFLKELDAGS